MTDNPELPIENFTLYPMCRKCDCMDVQLEYCGQEREVTSGAGAFVRFQGREILVVTCGRCGYFWHMAPADKPQAGRDFCQWCDEKNVPHMHSGAEIQAIKASREG